MLRSHLVKQAATQVGFTLCGIAPATPLRDDEFPLRRWLANGYQADMHYMERNVDMRLDPGLLLPGAQSIIAVALAYKSDTLMQGPARIAQYAYGEDYHLRLKRMLHQLIQHLATLTDLKDPKDLKALFRTFVDTAPISDRHWAQRAGLGWIARNSLLIHPRYGTYLFLGEIVTTLPTDHYDQPLPQAQSPCNNCTRCIHACPNHAIHPDGLVDARRCTSYNTIENRNPTLPTHLQQQHYAFGCDICQIACPINAQAPVTAHLTTTRKTQLEQLPNADPSTFTQFTTDTPLSRITYTQWQRNLAPLRHSTPDTDTR